MKNLVFIAVAGVLLTLAVMGLTMVIRQAQIKNREQIKIAEASKPLYEQELFHCTEGYLCSPAARDCVKLDSAKVFVNEEYVLIHMFINGKMDAYVTGSGKWPEHNLFKSPEETVRFSGNTIVARSYDNSSISLITR